jgi:hypothetical protein
MLRRTIDVRSGRISTGRRKNKSWPGCAPAGSMPGLAPQAQSLPIDTVAH